MGCDTWFEERLVWPFWQISSNNFSIVLKFIFPLAVFSPPVWITILALKKGKSANTVSESIAIHCKTVQLFLNYQLTDSQTHFLALHIINLGNIPHNYLGNTFIVCCWYNFIQSSTTLGHNLKMHMKCSLCSCLLPFQYTETHPPLSIHKSFLVNS